MYWLKIAALVDVPQGITFPAESTADLCHAVGLAQSRLHDSRYARLDDARGDAGREPAGPD